MRWAVAETGDGGARLCPLDQEGRPAGPVLHEPSLAQAVRSRPEVERWVWRCTTDIYRPLLAAGVRVERCYDVQAAESLLIGHEEGQSGQARSLAAAWARLHNLPVPPDAPIRAAETQPSLFDSGPAPLPPGVDEFTALLEVYAAQVARTAKTEHPDRMRLLLAAESAGMLVATELNLAGIPWRADVHRELLDNLLGERFPGGLEPRRMAELADEVSRAFGNGVRVRPDLPQDIIRALPAWGFHCRPRGNGNSSESIIPRWRRCWRTSRSTGCTPRTAGPGWNSGYTTAGSGPNTCPAARFPAGGPPMAVARCRFRR